MEIRTIFDFDELNRIYASTQGSEYDMQKMLEASYMLGLHFAYENLMGREPTEDEIDDLLDLQLLNDTVWKETAGKNFAQRLQEYQINDESASEKSKEESNASSSAKTGAKKSEGKTADQPNSYGLSPEIQRLLETEYHRIFDTSCHDTAKAIEKATGKKVYKTWQTQKDDRVRDSHVYLQGQTVPLEKEFYTYDNKHAQYPSGFNDPDEDINCRCYLSYSFRDDNGNKDTQS